MNQLKLVAAIAFYLLLIVLFAFGGFKLGASVGSKLGDVLGGLAGAVAAAALSAYLFHTARKNWLMTKF